MSAKSTLPPEGDPPRCNRGRSLSSLARRKVARRNATRHSSSSLPVRKAPIQASSNMNVQRIALFLYVAQALFMYCCCHEGTVSTAIHALDQEYVGPPEIMPFSFSKNVVLGQKTTVTCVVSSGTGPYRFEWKHGDRRVVGDSRRHVQNFADNVGALTIEAIAAEDLGNYTCTVANSFGSASYSSALVVEDRPRIQPLAFPEIVNLGEEVTVTCAVALGRKPFQFAWTKDGKPMVSSETKHTRIVVGNVALMTIQRVGAEDMGNYTCTVSNDFGSDSATARLIVDDVAKPDIQPFAFSKNTALGHKTSVACFATGGTEPFHFQWTHDGRPVADTATRHVKEATANMVTLVFDKLVTDDFGNYTCTVRNAHGTSSYTAELVVEGTLAVMPFSFSKNVALGQRQMVTCVVSSGVGPFRFAWTHGDQPVNTDSRRQVKVLAENVAALSIEAVRAEDLGNYTCTASNAAGRGIYTASLVVDAPPVIMPFSFAEDTVLGDRVLLTCAVTRGTAPFSISWTHRGRPIVDSINKHATLLSGNVATLTIEKVSAEDVGNYTCTATNAAGSGSFTAALTIEVEPPRMQPFTFPVIKQASKKVTVHCAVFEGSEPLEFAWFKDGSRLGSDAGRNLQVKQLSETASALTIPQVGAEDVGNYTCVASNAAGSDSVTSPLIVTDFSERYSTAMLVISLLATTTLLASSIEAAQGHAIAVTCIASQGTQPLHFEWLKDGRPLPVREGSKAISRMVTASVSVLTVLDVGAEDVGNYTCAASNAVGRDSFTAELVVAAPKLQPVLIAKDHPLLETLVVSCIAIRGSQPLKFAWFKDGRPLNEGTRAVPRVLTDTLSTLTIPKVTAEDVGNYTCRVSNEAGSDSYSAELLVTERPLIMPFSFPENAVLGQRTTVTCVVSSGTGPFQLAWTQNGNRVDSSHRRHVKIFSENVAALTIEAIAAEDVGNYTCAVSNAAGSARYTAALRVEERPLIMPFSFPENAVLGQKTTVTCVVSSAAGPFHFTWTHDANRVDSSHRRHVKILTENVAALTIEAIAAEDVGNYTCTVSNAAGNASYTAALRVEAPPMIMPISLANNIVLGEKILLTCAVTRGTAPFDIRWTHEGRQFANTKNKYAAAVTGNIATLTIEKVTAMDVGNYSCTASNDVGSDTVTATLMVEEAPQIQPFVFPKDPRPNSKMVISCNAHIGTEPVTFTWLKDGQELVSGTKVKHKIVSETVSMLTIPEVSSDDIGNYTCEATNRFGRDTFTAALVLTESPKIQPFAFPKDPPVGKDVTVTCFATEGALPLAFVWLKDGVILAGGSKFTIRNPLDKMSTLVVHDVRGADVGNYSCRVSNEAGNDVFTASLLVTESRGQCTTLYISVEAPKVQPFSFPTTKAMPKKVIVHCAVLEGTEPLKFVWTKDGLPVENGHRLHVEQHSGTLSSLTITDVGAGDIGNYTCTVSNVAGSDRATSQLLVKGEAI
ncbi:hypothetical protein HPB50_006466 [Hyalomma asiaticum]|uniref:Uncharacterized protein n=1 Tax=Hyalomma asiaticum TaxID=266040 RepID=A0ACB7RJW1_HYAAI|nr:hypothetical protein HPB50_006466 [Hyalomma asiaticum]